MSRTVGVMHATHAPDAPFPDAELFDLETLAKLGGARIGMLRLMSETQLQAATARATKAETDWAEAATAQNTVANLNGKLEALQTQLTQQAKALDAARQDARKASETAAELRGKHGRRNE